jgi:hypothetical protein
MLQQQLIVVFLMSGAQQIIATSKICSLIIFPYSSKNNYCFPQQITFVITSFVPKIKIKALFTNLYSMFSAEFLPSSLIFRMSLVA